MNISSHGNSEHSIPNTSRWRRNSANVVANLGMKVEKASAALP